MSTSSFDKDCVFDISILGGYGDERQCSVKITETLFTLMNSLEASFSLKVLCTGIWNFNWPISSYILNFKAL